MVKKGFKICPLGGLADHRRGVPPTSPSWHLAPVPDFVWSESDPNWDALGTLRGHSGDALGTLWGHSGNALGTLWDTLGALWDTHGTLWDALGELWGHSGTLWGRSGMLWDALGAV